MLRGMSSGFRFLVRPLKESRSLRRMTELLLLGGTGLVGGHVLRLALADDRIERVIAPTRRPLPSGAGIPHPKLENPVVDFDALPADAPWWEADAVVCALGTTIKQAGSREAFRKVDVDHVVAAAEIAQRHGAMGFALTSALNADPKSLNFYLRTKGDAEQALRKLGYLSLTIVRPSMIGGERQQRRPLEHATSLVLRALAPLVPRRYRVNQAADIARVLLQAAITAESGVRVVESDAITAV
jgi:uncharacterized protein YbjT (DUF2867 family)